MIFSNNSCLPLRCFGSPVFIAMSDFMAAYSLFLESNCSSWEFLSPEIVNSILSKVIETLQDEIPALINDDVRNDVTIVAILAAALPFVDGFTEAHNSQRLILTIRNFEDSDSFAVQNLMALLTARTSDFLMPKYQLTNDGQNYVSSSFLCPLPFVHRLANIYVANDYCDLRYLKLYEMDRVWLNLHCVRSRASRSQDLPLNLAVNAMIRFISRCCVLRNMLFSLNWTVAARIISILEEDISIVEEFSVFEGSLLRDCIQQVAHGAFENPIPIRWNNSQLRTWPVTETVIAHVSLDLHCRIPSLITASSICTFPEGGYLISIIRITWFVACWDPSVCKWTAMLALSFLWLIAFPTATR